MNKILLKKNLLLALTALIWGAAFVAQSVGMDYVGPFTFLAVRNLIAGLVLLLYILLSDRRREARGLERGGWSDRNTLLGGVCCGTALFCASSMQQIGLQQTSAGKAGFLTALYIVIVPLLGLFVGKKVRLTVWLGVAVAVAGMYLLCITDGFAVEKGDLQVMACALLFSFHILIVDHFSPRAADVVKMSCIQFFVCCGISAVFLFVFESPDAGRLAQAWLPILYAGALSGGVGYTLQIVGQKDNDPTVASLIMSLESVFAVLAGWLLLQERLSPRELAGCVLVFAAILLAQMPEKKKKTKKEDTLC